MSLITEQIIKTLRSAISPDELQDIKDYPKPWTSIEAGNGHLYICDANNVQIAHVYCYNNSDWKTFYEKMKEINS